MIRDKYARGSVSILDLLDAQNQAFVRDQEAAIAVYRYLSDVVEFQRSIAWFATFKTEEEQNEWLDQFEKFGQD